MMVSPGRTHYRTPEQVSVHPDAVANGQSRLQCAFERRRRSVAALAFDWGYDVRREGTDDWTEWGADQMRAAVDYLQHKCGVR